VEPFTEDHYEGSSSFLQQDLQDFPILLYINQICPQAGRHFILGHNFNILSFNQNHFNNFGRGPGIIPVEFGQISISGSREEVV